MSKTKKLILFFVINSSLLLIALALVIFGRIISNTPYQHFFDCPSLLMFDLYCPFCGATRALGELLDGRILSALIYNPAFILFIPYFIYYDIASFISIIKKEKLPNINKWVSITLIAVLVANWIFRNALLIIFDIDYIAMLGGIIS